LTERDVLESSDDSGFSHVISQVHLIWCLRVFLSERKWFFI
jgi:hypothetical protein